MVKKREKRRRENKVARLGGYAGCGFSRGRV